MDTTSIMALATSLARQKRVPEDSQIYVPAKEVRRPWFGIDADVGTLLAAKSLGHDLVIAHHPLGGAAALNIWKVYAKHGDILVRSGVPKKAADAAVRAMQAEHAPRLHASNYDHVPSLARQLGIPLMSIHNPCDEIGRRVMDETLQASIKKKSKVEDAVRSLSALPEFANAETEVVVRMGKRSGPVGKWAVQHGAGTNGGFHVANAAFEHGVDTVVYIHIDPGQLGRLCEKFGPRGPKNLIVTGHVASDSIGINVLVRAMREKGLAVTCGSGIVEA